MALQSSQRCDREESSAGPGTAVPFKEEEGGRAREREREGEGTCCCMALRVGKGRCILELRGERGGEGEEE